MDLPYDPDLVHPEALLEWIGETDVEHQLLEIDQYPRRPLLLSDYRLDPPRIRVYRYLPIEDWLNLACQRQAGFYGPWYYLHLAFRFYCHLEINGMYEVERKWFHRLLGRLSSLEDRAYHFTQTILETRFPPHRFDQFVERSFIPKSRA